jgi:hypothetical protein
MPASTRIYVNGAFALLCNTFTARAAENAEVARQKS